MLNTYFCSPPFSRIFGVHCLSVKPQDIDVGIDTASDQTTEPPSPTSSRGGATPQPSTERCDDNSRYGFYSVLVDDDEDEEEVFLEEDDEVCRMLCVQCGPVWTVICFFRGALQ